MFTLRDISKKVGKSESTPHDSFQGEGHKKSRAIKIFLQGAWYTTMTLVVVVNLLLTMVLYAQVGDRENANINPPQSSSGLYKAIYDGNLLTLGAVRYWGEKSSGVGTEAQGATDDKMTSISGSMSFLTKNIKELRSDIDDIQSQISNIELNGSLGEENNALSKEVSALSGEIEMMKIGISQIDRTVDTIESDVKQIKIFTVK